MDRIWQWAWDRYGARYSWAVWAIGVPLLLQVYLLFAIVIVAFEKSDHYVEAAAVALVATLVHQYVVILPGLGRIRLVERWAENREVDRESALDATYSMTRGAVVRAVGSGFLRGLGGPLTDGEVIDAAGLHITVMATPGHTADSLSFVLDDAVLTADTVLGQGTTVIDSEDGSLGEYLQSLERLQGLGHRTVLPGHGPDLDDLEAVTAMYLTHREQRLAQVRDALQALGDDATARQIVEHVYTDVDEKLWEHAEWSVQAQLNYLRD